MKTKIKHFICRLYAVLATWCVSLTLQAQQLQLPECRFMDAAARLNIEIENYDPQGHADFIVRYFETFGSQGSEFNAMLSPDEKGHLELDIPLKTPRLVEVCCSTTTDILMVPGGVYTIHMRMEGNEMTRIALEGDYATVSQEYTHLTEGDSYDQTFPSDKALYQSLKKCTSPEERLRCIEKHWQQMRKRIEQLKCSEESRELLRLKSDAWMLEMCTDFGSEWIAILNGAGEIDYNSLPFEQVFKLMTESAEMLPEEVGKPFAMKKNLECIHGRYAPLCQAFWSNPDIVQFSTLKETHNRELMEGHMYLSVLELIEDLEQPTLEDVALNHYVDSLTLAHQAKVLAAKADTVQHIFKGTLDSIAPELLVKEILKRYPGKRVLFDMWETWCGPCRQGHKEMAPMKEELRGSNIVFVNLSSPSSQLSIWDNMVQTIEGDHFLITTGQSNYLKQLWDSNSIPIYAIYDSEGTLLFKCSGFPGVEKIRSQLISAR